MDTSLRPLLRRLPPGPLDALRQASVRWREAALARRTRRERLPTRLAAGGLLRLRIDAPRQLSVRQGRVWLTRPGDPADHFLSAGDALWLAGSHDVLIGAEGGGEAWLGWAAAGARPRRPEALESHATHDNDGSTR